jgi:uncharacterized protein (TIGR02757 family)
MLSQELLNIKSFLDAKVDEFNTPTYIETDPIQIPHQFSVRENIEISAFLTATIAWGQRKSIIKNAKKMMQLMDNNPYQYILNANENELANLDQFKHRTFNGVDLKFFVLSLRNIYMNHGGLKTIFEESVKKNDVKYALSEFRNIFLKIDHEKRSEKHISSIDKNSAAKRLNMFLRWMVRRDNRGVDFGIWDIPMLELYIPLDVHCGNVARKLGILQRKQNDWKAVEELMEVLKKFDSNDPVKYDYALFGLGVFEKF